MGLSLNLFPLCLPLIHLSHVGLINQTTLSQTVGSPPLSPKNVTNVLASRTGAEHKVARTSSPSQLSQSILFHQADLPGTSPLVERPKASPSKSSSKKDRREKEEKEKGGFGAKIKRKGGWLSSFKSAANLSTSSTHVTSTSMSSASSVLSGSASGGEDVVSSATASYEKTTAAYIPPWMSSSNVKSDKASSSGGFASRIKIKRRSLSDGVSKKDKKGGANISGEEDGKGKGQSATGFLMESDLETDDGEEREGIAWEDVPVEALAMVIPLRVEPSKRQLGSASTSATGSSSNSGKASSSRRSSDFAFFGGWSPSDSPEIGPPAPSPVLLPAENSLLVYFVPFGNPTEVPDDSRPLSPSSLLSTTPTNALRFIKPGSKLHKTSSQIFQRSHASEKHVSASSSKATVSANTRHNAFSPPPNVGRSKINSRAVPSAPPNPSLRPQTASHHSSNYSSTSNQSSLLSSLASGLSSSPSKASTLARGSLTRNSSTSVLASPRARFAPFPSSSPFPSHNASFSSFRIVARIVDPSDLTFLPSWPSWESQPFAATAPPGLGQTVDVTLSGPGTNPETKAKETKNSRTDPTVVGVCHGNTTGVEFVREGWERLGFLKSRIEEDGSTPSEDIQALESALRENGLNEVLGCVVAACVAILG